MATLQKQLTGNTVEVPIDDLQEKRILHLGGLTILDEGQYILLDGKEVPPASYGKLTGPYRITFVDGKEAEKKYGSKGKNGAYFSIRSGNHFCFFVR